MALVQGGDQAAYGALLDDVMPLLRAFLRRRVTNVNEIDDILQDVLLSVHRARHTYDPGRPLEPWLFAIARNVTIDHARRAISRSAWEIVVDDLPDAPADAAGDATPRLEEVLAKLPPAQRRAFEMLKIEGLSVEIAAARAGTSPGALKVRAHRAYKAVRALLGGGDE